VKRFEVNVHDFSLVGRNRTRPRSGRRDVVTALQKIKAGAGAFASRGDKSGTHLRRASALEAAGIDTRQDKGPWYRDTGSGMGPTAEHRGGQETPMHSPTAAPAVVQEPRRPGDLVWRAISACSTSTGLDPLNPARQPACQEGDWRQTFVDWVISPEGQKAIAEI